MKISTVAYLKTQNITDYELQLLDELFSNFNPSQIQATDLSQITQKDQIYDLLLCFSDSDLLSAINTMCNFPKYILVVELPGDNSFFAQSTLINLKEDLLRIIESKTIQKDVRSLLKIEIENKQYLALNDIHISSSTINARLRYDVLVDSASIFSNEPDSANALLLSTPTGSTAMSLNLGGAVLHPQAGVFQFQAIASRNLLSNHYIIPDSSKINIEIVEAKFPIVINIDNYQMSTTSDNFTITKSNSNVVFLKLENERDMTQKKLSNKISFEDTQSLTSSAKFILHVLQNDRKKSFTVNELSEITHITNQKTIRNAIKLLMEKGLIKRKENLLDLREHLYFSI